MSPKKISLNQFQIRSLSKLPTKAISPEMSYRNGVPSEFFLWERRSFAFPRDASLDLKVYKAVFIKSFRRT